MNLPKRTITILTTLLVTSCANLGEDYNRSMDAFEFSQDCPVGCFLGITPLVTTPKEALHILESSPEIDKSTLSIIFNNGIDVVEDIDDSSLLLLKDGDTLNARWTPTNDKHFEADIHIGITNNVVDYVSVHPVSVTIQDFISTVGEPDKIQVGGMQLPDASYLLVYSIFYNKWKLLIYVQGADIDGPQPKDEINYVALNQEISQADFRLWDGYGKMRTYMTTELLNHYQSSVQTHSTANP